LSKKRLFHLNLSKKSIKDWIISQQSSVLFFDELKGNPHPAGSGGLIFDSKGVIASKFSWNLGATIANNMVEYLAILQVVECLVNFTVDQIT